jgi:hypothetical protein
MADFQRKKQMPKTQVLCRKCCKVHAHPICKVVAALILLLLAAPCYGYDPPPPPAPAVTLPVLPMPAPPPGPKPVPAPAAGPVVLAADVLYVASSKADCLLLLSTTDAGKAATDIFRVTPLKGPVTFALSKFVDGSGKRETKTYSDPFIWCVEAIGSGTIEALWVPKTGVADGAVVRQLITTNTAPIPPPDPPIPPKPPDPPPAPAPIPLSGFRTLIQFDPATLTADQQGIVFGKRVRDYLRAKSVVGSDGQTKDFWIIEAGLDVSAAPKWIGDVIQRHPGQKSFMVVSDGKTGFDGPIPADADAAMAILQKVGGM